MSASKRLLASIPYPALHIFPVRAIKTKYLRKTIRTAFPWVFKSFLMPKPWDGGIKINWYSA